MKYSPLTMWGIVIAIGVGTYFIRLSFIALFGKIEPSPAIMRATRFVPSSVMAAIILPALLNGGGHGFGDGSERLIAALLAGFVAWRTGNMVATIGTGMVGLWLLKAVVSL